MSTSARWSVPPSTRPRCDGHGGAPAGPLWRNGDRGRQGAPIRREAGRRWRQDQRRVLRAGAAGSRSDRGRRDALRGRAACRLAADGQLAAFLHDGFWQPMDTLRDRTQLEELWAAAIRLGRHGDARRSIDPGFWRGRRVLLTGHTGFKGAWTALWLKRLGAAANQVKSRSPRDFVLHPPRGAFPRESPSPHHPDRAVQRRLPWRARDDVAVRAEPAASRRSSSAC